MSVFSCIQNQIIKGGWSNMAEKKEEVKQEEFVEEQEQQEEVKGDTSKTEKKSTRTTKKKEDTPTSNKEVEELQSQIKTLESQLNEKDNSISELQTKLSNFETKAAEQTATIQQKDVELKLAQKGLSEFKEFFANVESENVDEQIEKFQSLMKKKELDNSFKPSDHKQDDKLSQAKNKGDLRGYLGQLMFGNK